jgi:GT2 family glycosyltransferase
LTDYNNITVIIPAINFNGYLDNCLKKIFTISFDIKIILVCDKISYKFKELELKYKNLEIIIPKVNFNISQKRNLAAKKTKTKYIAFIDSDAYPDKYWIKNSLEILNDNKEIFLVGGPNISPLHQNYQKKIIGEVQKSFLITGKWNFQKFISKSRFCQNLYSCNMIMFKEFYINNGGMNELLNTGEDYDFCNKINDNGKRIFFNISSIVYHYDRNFINFIIQKIIRGYTIIDQIKKRTSLFKKNILEFLIYQLAPLYFLMFVILSLFILKGFFLNYFFLKFFIISIFVLYLLTSIYSLRHVDKKNFINLPIILIFTILGNLAIGLGSFLSFFNLNKIYKIYKNN